MWYLMDNLLGADRLSDYPMIIKVLTDCFCVAEKSRVCRCRGRFSTIASTVAENP